jgi:hypothetical protein
MRKIFSHTVFALAVGLCLRMYFVLKHPAGSGDAILYEQIATNWLKHHVYAMDVGGAITPVDIRVPGYPAFLAVIYWLSGKVGAEARFWVMTAQAVVDTLSCAVAAVLAVVLGWLAWPGRVRVWRVFFAGLWLAVLCPFTANYVAVPLTETLATFFTALGVLLLCLMILRFRAADMSEAELDGLRFLMRWRAEWWGALAGTAVGLGALFRPETPLLLITAVLVMGWYWIRAGEWRRMARIFLFMGAGCVVPLLPWAIRNTVTLHEVQFLAPKNSNLPGELVPYGFMAWEKTWLFRLRDCYVVAWKLNDDVIKLEDVPARASDTEEEKERVEELLEKYNDDETLTSEEDAGFGQLAKERTARHPLRTYVWLPGLRALMLWFTPRIELLPLSGEVFPLRQAWEDDPVDQSVTSLFGALNAMYVALGAWGAWRMRRAGAARMTVALLVSFISLRTAFLATLETPEPRYVLVCFPVLFALGAQVFGGRLRSDGAGLSTVERTMRETA